jgi:hypothetical protein
MSKLSNKFAASVPFAHLLGIKAESNDDEKKKDEDAKSKSKAQAEDGDEKQGDNESDEDYEKRKESAKAKSKSSAEDDDKEKEDAKAKGYEIGVLAERKRCALILAHGLKTGCAHQASVFAFDTSMSADSAILAMGASALDSKQSSGLASMMSAVANPRVTADAGQSTQFDLSTKEGLAKAQAAQIIASASKARGEVKEK